MELLKLKDSTNDKGFITLTGGQPEFTNEDLEDELTEVRPLDMPLDILEVETSDDVDHVTSTMRTFSEVDVGGLTTVSSRLSDLQLRQKIEAAFKSDIELGNWDQDEDIRTDEADHSGDGINHSQNGISHSQNGISSTQQHNNVDILKKGKQSLEVGEDDDGDDDDEDDDSNDEESDEDEDSGGDDDDDEGEESDSDDGEDEDDENDDDIGDDEDDDRYLNQGEGKNDQFDNEKRTNMQKKIKTSERKLDDVRPETNFDASIEHGRRWKEADSSEASQEVTKSPLSRIKELTPVTTNIPEIPRDSSRQNLMTLLKNGSPEMEDHESWNISDSNEENVNTGRQIESQESKIISEIKLEEARDHVKKGVSSQKLVDSVSPKADEDLLELMIRIAENPSEWQQVHRELQLLDQDLVTTRKSLEELNGSEKSNYKKDKKNRGDVIKGISNKTDVPKESRKHLQGEKKKKKKKKQKQKGKLKNKVEKLKVKEKEEIRREELEKAGVLSPSNALYDGNVKIKTSNISKETSKSKNYWNKSPKDSVHSKMNVNSLYFLDPPKNITANRKELPVSDFITKETMNKYLSDDFRRNGENDQMSSIDSALKQLTAFRSPLTELNTNKLPSDTVKSRYNNHKSKNNKVVSNNNSWLKANDIENEIDSSWPSNVDHRKNDKNNWYATVSNPKLSKDIPDSRASSSDWHNPFIRPNKLKYRILEQNGLIGTPRFSAPLEGSSDTYTWQTSGSNFDTWPDANSKNPKEERRYYNDETIYNSPNSGWPRFSVESLKHGNDKTWPDISIDGSIGTNKDYNNPDKTPDWPNTSLETEASKIKNWNSYNSPNFSDNTKQNIISGKVNIWSKPVVDSSKEREIITNTWPQAEQKHISAIDTAIAHHTKEASNNRQWPHFTYHRVTSSPQILAQQQKEAQQRTRQRNAYIAVSVITPPGKNKGFSKQQTRNNSSSVYVKNKSNESPINPSVTPLPDKIDQLLSMRSESQKFPDRDLLEEQLVDMTISGEQQQRPIPWSHARHLDKIQEQLKTLSAMGEKLQYHWLEKERLLQILRDGGKSGSSFYRSQRNGNIKQESVTTSSTVASTTSSNSPSLAVTPQTTIHHSQSP